MKRMLAKKTLLLGALALLANTAPTYSMDDADLPAELQEEVVTVTERHSGWTTDALQKKLKNTMDLLNKEWNKFMKCAKGEGCDRRQVRTVVSILLSILGIVAALSGARAVMKSDRAPFKAIRENVVRPGQDMFSEYISGPASSKFDTYVGQPVGAHKKRAQEWLKQKWNKGILGGSGSTQEPE